MIYTLGEADALKAAQVTRLRCAANKAVGARDRKRSTDDDYAVALNGFGGEIALARLLHIEPDWSTHPRGAGDDPFDLWWHGFSIDVKTTHHVHGRLLVPPWKRTHPADFYCLMTGSFPTFQYHGCLPGAEVFKPARYQQWPGVEFNYTATQADLHPLPSGVPPMSKDEMPNTFGSAHVIKEAADVPKLLQLLTDLDYNTLPSIVQGLTHSLKKTGEVVYLNGDQPIRLLHWRIARQRMGNQQFAH